MSQYLCFRDRVVGLLLDLVKRTMFIYGQEKVDAMPNPQEELVGECERSVYHSMDAFQ